MKRAADVRLTGVATRQRAVTGSRREGPWRPSAAAWLARDRGSRQRRGRKTQTPITPLFVPRQARHTALPPDLRLP